MLLVLRHGKFGDNLLKKTLIAWISCTNKPRDTSRLKKYKDSGMKSNKSDKNATSEKKTPRPTYTSRTRGTSQTSVSLFQKGPDTSVTHP